MSHQIELLNHALATGELPPALAGLGRTEAIAFVSRLFDAAESGARPWDDGELTYRFLQQCSRSGSDETRRAYSRDLANLGQWIEAYHPGLLLRQFGPHHAEAFVDDLRRSQEAGQIAARTYNRRISTVSALFNWASEPQRSGLSGIARNPIPRRSLIATPKVARALSEAELQSILGAVDAAARAGDRTARRDRVMLRGAYLLGFRVSELARLRWRDVEALELGGLVHILGKGAKVRTVRISAETLGLFESLGRGQPDAYVFPGRNGQPLTRQAIGGRCRRWGLAADVHLHPNRLRHSHATHAVRKGVDIFTLRLSMGHASVGTTATYVAPNPTDSSSLRLG